MNNQHLTIAYVTARQQPRFDWFVDSLSAQMAEVDLGHYFQLLIIDFFARERPIGVLPMNEWGKRARWEKPKPTVWQGKHRLTSVDYFAAANARNTALCYAPDGWIAYVDDVSVLMPHWLDRVIDATKREGKITVGAYRKVFDLEVENGLVKNYRGDHLGVDTRNTKGRKGLIHCDGGWLYCSSCVIPVEALLTVNGWDENCDGLGFEDVITGQLLSNAGFPFVYDTEMVTYESLDLHKEPVPMKRTDKGVSPKDKSHAILHSTRMRKWAPNYFGDEGIRGLRQRILSGEPFPPIACPDRDWFDGQLLSEM